jgi:hypothetical protein
MIPKTRAVAIFCGGSILFSKKYWATMLEQAPTSGLISWKR